MYLGIDIGTTATKAVVFTKNGEVISQYAKDYAMYHPQPDWSVQKPTEILTAVLECLANITQTISPKFISFSSAMQSILAVDKHGNPLTDLILWADNRANDVANNLKNSSNGLVFYQKTGIPIHTFCPLTKILWFRDNEPDIFAKAYKFISIKEYIWHHLTGEYVVDSSMASGTGLMNIETLAWDSEILSHIGINETKLSKIVSPTYSAKSITDGFTLFIGGGDGALANLGTGAMQKGRMSLTIGTSGAVRLPIEKPFFDPLMRTQCYHLLDRQYLVLGAINNGAVVIQWLKEAILQSDEPYEALFEQVTGVSAGSDGLIFVPYLLGERAPIWDASAKGTLLGITINHTKAHFIRATLEGILFGLLSITEVLLPDENERKSIVIMASGGFTKSEEWLQMAADVFQMKVVVTQAIEGSAWGAVMIGLDALGIKIVENEVDDKIFMPNAANFEVYEEGFRKYKKVYGALRNL